MRFRIVFKRGVSPPFKRLKLNFLPIFGLFWASLVFLFTYLSFNGLHYLNNVVQQNGCFPLFIRVSALFAILPVIVPFLSLPFFLCLPSFPSFLPSFLSLPSFWFFGLGSWADPRRSRQIPGRSRQNEQNEQNELYLRLNQLACLFDILHRFMRLGRSWAKKRGF